MSGRATRNLDEATDGPAHTDERQTSETLRQEQIDVHDTQGPR
jgi:hypothetical protein